MLCLSININAQTTKYYSFTDSIVYEEYDSYNDYTSTRIATIPLLTTYAILQINGFSMTDNQRDRVAIMGIIITTGTFFLVEGIKKNIHKRKMRNIY